MRAYVVLTEGHVSAAKWGNSLSSSPRCSFQTTKQPELRFRALLSQASSQLKLTRIESKSYLVSVSR
jgi:hypothetical protein